MEGISMQGKTNFFEERPTEYKKATEIKAETLVVNTEDVDF
jgi:ribonucleotide reductase beta subunit family protein with ferritin-like domain